LGELTTTGARPSFSATGTSSRNWPTPPTGGSTVVLFSSSSVANVDTTDAQRLGFTLIGAALVLLASGTTLLWARHQQPHTTAPTVGKPATA